MKVLFVAQNFQIGGIQKALVNTLKELHKESKYSIEVFSFGDGLLLNEIPPGIKVNRGSLLLRLVATPFLVVKDKGNILHLLIRIVSMIFVRISGSEKFYRYLFRRQKKLNKYDIAISYFNDVQGNYFNRGTNQFVDEFIEASKKIAWLHTDPIKARFNHDDSLFVYRNFDSIVCVSEACRQKFVEILPEYESKTRVVYNIFPVDDIIKKAKEYIPFECNEISIITVGRIDNSTKRMNIIPQICRKLKDALVTNFHWRIVGDGPDLKKNKNLVNELDVGDLVDFVGEQVNPYPYIKHSHLFVLTSAYEGYPMVVIESLILGTPIVATCYAAAKEQIMENYNGIISSMDLENIYSTIRQLLEKPNEIMRMKDYIRNNGFSNKIAINQLNRELEIINEN